MSKVLFVEWALLALVYLTLTFRWAYISFSNIKAAGRNDAELLEVDTNIFMNSIYLVIALVVGLIMPIVALFRPHLISSFWQKVPA